MGQNSQNESSIKTNIFKQFFSERWEKIKSMKAKDWLNFFLNNAIVFLLIIFIIIVAVIGANKAVPVNIFSITSIINIVENSSRVMFLALGVGGIIILTGTDLSAGRILGFTGIIAAALLQLPSLVTEGGSGTTREVFPGLGVFPIPVVIIIVVIVGGIFGIINGFFVAKFKLHPFIVTLATSLIIFGLANIIVGDSGFVSNLAPSYSNFYNLHLTIFGRRMGLYVIYAIAAIILTWFIWNHTTFGKNMYAVGSNPEAANVSGINVNLTIMLVFMYAGLLYGFSGFLWGAKEGNVRVTLGDGFELNAIAACVIGGISFAGGVGKIRGVLLGVLIIQYLSYGLEVIGIPVDQRNIFTGAIILLAVTIDMRKYLTKR